MIKDATTHVHDAFGDWIRDRKNRRIIPHRLNEAGYEPLRNSDSKDGLWKIEGQRQVIYARKDLSLRDRIAAAARLLRSESSI